MQTVKIPADRILGLTIGPDKWQIRLNKRQIRLNKREVDVLDRAIKIREEVRDRLREGMGVHEFEASDLYTLEIDDLIETPHITFNYDFSGDRI